MKIAIDGPAGAGKSSVAREVARRLGFKYLDTGAMYRAITFYALEEGVNLQDEDALASLTHHCVLEIKDDEQKGNLIMLNGKDITEEIRQPLVNQYVSIVAASSGVRRELVNLQRKTALKCRDIVMEGRDIGTNVLVDADFKFYISASVEERAKRRWLEMCEKKMEIAFTDLLNEISMRDRIDQERADSPLRISPDACVIATTLYSLTEVVEKVLAAISVKNR